MAVARKNIYTPDEYLEMEEHSKIRHEFVNGEIYDMSGGTANHNQISGNIYEVAKQRSANYPCRSFIADMRVRIKKANAFAYPDVMIVCGKVEFDSGRKDVVTNPTVIFEVLSDSTANYDHGRKFAIYRQLGSLQEYVLVDQHRVFVECYRRTESGLWTYESYDALEDTLHLQSVERDFDLATIYADAELETDDADSILS